MKITSLLSNLITEQSRFQVLYDKMVKPAPSREGDVRKPKGLMDFETLKALILADPTTIVPQGEDIDSLTLNKMDGVKVGKFAQWILKTYLDKNPSQMQLPDDVDMNSSLYKSSIQEYRRQFMEDLTHLRMLLTKYDKFKTNIVKVEDKDINKIKSVEQLSKVPVKLSFTIKDGQGRVVEKGDEVLELEVYPIEGKKRIKKDDSQEVNTKFDVPGSEILKVGSEYTLIRIADKGPLGSEAASYFGGYDGGLEKGESNWCTAARGSSYSNSYRKDGPLYIIIANDAKGKVGKVTGLPEERYQVHFPSNQFRYRNQQGGNFPVVEFFNGKFSDLKDALKHEFAKGLVQKGGDKVEINYPESSSGTFIALYGFDELFNTLPVTIKHLLINNKSKDKIALDVPESISRFQHLDALLLQNIVKTIPDSIGDIKNLNFLSLPDNTDLKSIPESVAHLPNLAFLNLKGSKNVKLPPSLEEKLIDEGSGFYYVSN